MKAWYQKLPCYKWNKPHQSLEVVGCLVSSNIGPSNCRYAPYMIKLCANLFTDRKCLLRDVHEPHCSHEKQFLSKYIYRLTQNYGYTLRWFKKKDHYLNLSPFWKLSKLNSSSFKVIFAPRLIEIGKAVLWRKILKCGYVCSKYFAIMFAAFRLFEFKSL